MSVASAAASTASGSAPPTERTPLTINGAPSAAASSSSSSLSTGISIHSQVPDDTPFVSDRVRDLNSTFKSGRTKPIAWRREALQALRQVIVESKSEIFAALKSDLNKCAFESWLAEYQFVLSEIDESLHSLSDWMAPKSVNTNLLNLPGSSSLVSDPLGTVLIIAPWNYPFQLAIAPLVGALAAGNTVLLKPSEIAPAVSAWIGNTLARALEPHGVRVVQGGIAPTQAVLKHQFDLIFYTGGGPVGKVILRAAAEFLTPVVLELGGKSPGLVLADANLKIAARRIAWGKLMNAGQTCIAPDYLLVEKRVHDEFVANLAAEVQAMYGAQPNSSPDYGRIINTAHTRRLAALVQPLEDGQTAVVGDTDQIDIEAKYIPPLFITGVRPEHRVMADEIFGPILPIISIDGADAVSDMIEFVSSRPKPLALYLFTDSSSHVDRVLTSTSSGGVAVNDCLVHIVNPALPFGGVGPAGMVTRHTTHTHRTNRTERERTQTLWRRKPASVACHSHLMRRFVFFSVRVRITVASRSKSSLTRSLFCVDPVRPYSTRRSDTRPTRHRRRHSYPP